MDSDPNYLKIDLENQKLMELAIQISKVEAGLEPTKTENSGATGGATGSTNSETITKISASKDNEKSYLICAVCHDNFEDDDIVSPCKCKDSIGLHHIDCFQCILQNSTPSNLGKYYCRVCKSCYITNLALWNRDCNGSINIWKIMKSTINGLGRPKHLLRSNSSDTVIAVPKS